MQHDGLASARLLRPSLLGAACLLLLGACSSGSEPRDSLTGLPATGQVKLQLTRADSCGDLLTRVQDGLLAPLAARAEQLRNPANATSGGYYYPGTGGASGSGVGLATSAPPPSAGVPAPVASSNDGARDNSASQPGSAASGGTATGNAGDTPAAADPSVPAPETPVTSPGPSKDSGGGFSGTTVQVKDVDEADIVKTDGDQIYLLHGGSLFVLQGWPATDTSILGSASVEGQPSEMFVRDGKAIVFSSVYGNLAASVSGSAATPSVPYSNGSYTKLTVFDVSSDTPTVLRESYIEGDYVSARRHDALVRAVVQDGFKVPQLGNPYIEYVDAFGQPFPQADIDAQVDDWLERTVRSVRNTDLGDWLPREFSKANGQLVAEAPRCADYYAPDPGLTESGVTSVVSLDLDDVTAPIGGATILGRAERVYSNEDVVLVTQSDYRYQVDQGASEQTIVHRFDIAGKQTSYVASGAVPGTVQNQFSLDEQDGVIRISTTEQRWGIAQPGIAVPTAPGVTGSAGASTGGQSSGKDLAIAPSPAPLTGPINRVVTLGTDGGSLVQLGSTDGFGAGESIYGTRFIGDRGYVVTFRQTDPLFVIDLSDPKDPSVVGQLTIPGFSNYLFPLDDTHLFAIGQDATPTGQVQGLALQIFDVSDASKPTRTQRYVFPDAGASPANVDQRAISFHPNGNVIAFPYQKWDTGESTLEVFGISATNGFTRLGGMGGSVDFTQCLVRYGFAPSDIATIVASPDMAAQYQSYCRGSEYFRRGLFRDDFVYGISNTGVYSYALDRMADGAVARVSLPAETYTYGDYAGGDTASGGAVSGYGGEGNIAPPLKAAPPVNVGSGGASGSSDPSAPAPDEPSTSPKTAAE